MVTLVEDPRNIVALVADPRNMVALVEDPRNMVALAKIFALVEDNNSSLLLLSSVKLKTSFHHITEVPPKCVSCILNTHHELFHSTSAVETLRHYFWR